MTQHPPQERHKELPRGSHQDWWRGGAQRDGDLVSGRSLSKPSGSCQAPTPNLNALTVPESLILRGSEKTAQKEECNGLAQMLPLHSELSASNSSVCLFGVAKEDGGRSKQLPPLLDIAAVLGRGEVHEIKGRILLAGGAQLGELGQPKP